MPFEIQEIAINVSVPGTSGPPAKAGASGGCGGGDKKQDTDAIVRECVRTVLRILKQSEER